MFILMSSEPKAPSAGSSFHCVGEAVLEATEGTRRNISSVSSGLTAMFQAPHKVFILAMSKEQVSLFPKGL